MVLYLHLLAASWWENLKNLFDSPLALILLAVCVILFVVIVALIAALSVRYKVTYVYGEGEPETRLYYKHALIEQPDPAPRDGYSFEGWYTDGEFNNQAPEALRAKRRDIVLYARWKELIGNSDFEAEKEVEAATERQECSPECKDERAAAVSPEGEQNVVVSERETIQEEGASQTEGGEEAPVLDSSGEPEEEEDDSEAGEGDEIDNAVVTTVTGAKVFVQYRRSFQARLIQSDDETKELYNRVRSAILTVKGVKERTSWNYISFNKGRRQFAKINANRKSLILYLSLDPAEMDEKYNFRNVSEKKRYREVPVRLKITGSRSLHGAMDLIESAAEKNGLALQDFPFEQNLDLPYESRDALIRRNLIKVYAKKDTGESITEEQLEEFIEEGATVESLSSFTVTDKVSVNEAEKLVSDATAKQLMALADVAADRSPRVAQAKRAYINLDTIAANFKEGETVNLEALCTKKLIAPKASAVKVLARGSLDKALTIEASDFSLPAVKMIVITGGKVVKLNKN